MVKRSVWMIGWGLSMVLLSGCSSPFSTMSQADRQKEYDQYVSWEVPFLQKEYEQGQALQADADGSDGDMKQLFEVAANTLQGLRKEAAQKSKGLSPDMVKMNDMLVAYLDEEIAYNLKQAKLGPDQLDEIEQNSYQQEKTDQNLLQNLQSAIETYRIEHDLKK